MGISGWCKGKRLDSCSAVGPFMIFVHDDAAHEDEGSESFSREEEANDFPPRKLIKSSSHEFVV